MEGVVPPGGIAEGAYALVTEHTLVSRGGTLRIEVLGLARLLRITAATSVPRLTSVNRSRHRYRRLGGLPTGQCACAWERLLDGSCSRSSAIALLLWGRSRRQTVAALARSGRPLFF